MSGEKEQEKEKGQFQPLWSLLSTGIWGSTLRMRNREKYQVAYSQGVVVSHPHWNLQRR